MSAVINIICLNSVSADLFSACKRKFLLSPARLTDAESARPIPRKKRVVMKSVGDVELQATEIGSMKDLSSVDLSTRGARLSERLRKILQSPTTSFLMEAHNGLSARIVEETGFQGIWASGLAISASLGVRDANEASWTQILEVVEFMSDSADIPILLDGDTGYGNFNNVRRLVRKLCERNVAGVCIEDKVFPKANSFIGEDQQLADPQEFAGKIKAAKDSQLNDQFCVVARVEALVAGRGITEALKRADRYHAAGADAILIHSKKNDAVEVLEFAKRWQQQCPLIIVPTMYFAVPTKVFIDAKIAIVIWANHNLRASIANMRSVCQSIYESQSISSVERDLPSVRDIFKLVGQDELTEAESRYLPI